MKLHLLQVELLSEKGNTLTAYINLENVLGITPNPENEDSFILAFADQRILCKGNMESLVNELRAIGHTIIYKSSY